MAEDKKYKKLREFFSNKYNIVLVLILLFAFIVRMYFFFHTIEQPLWWDEAQYGEQARRLGLDLGTNNIWYYRRTMLLPVFWSFLFKIGFGETSLRFTEVLFSVLLVFATYLVGKKFFDKKVGLIAAFGVAFSRIILFETTRLLNSVPEASFMLLAVYFFYKGHLKENKPKYIYLAALFAGLAMSFRFAAFLSIISFVLLVFIKEKGKIWKNKHIFGAALLLLLILSPFFYSYQKNYPGGVKDFLRHYGGVGVAKEEKQQLLGWSGVYQYIKILPSNISWFLFAMFLIGSLFLLDFLLAPDLLFKEISLQKNLFLFLFILPPLIYHGLKSEYVEERYLIGILPVILIISAYGIIRLYEYLKDYNKYIFAGIIFVLLLASSYPVIKDANSIIENKKTSYQQVKEAALWIKENSKKGDVVISNSIPQTQYYSDRSTYYVEKEEEIKDLNPKYYVVSIYERSAQQYIEYPEKNKERFKENVKAWFVDATKTQPSLVIYEFKQDYSNKTAGILRKPGLI
ncbi:glycosyltransferase family 39 protein [Candidatus Woesearchaeota archaeon]|nr:glycosyltransferase family 39 protein [Candidatus Woesearchaeota archaeon]